MALMLEGMFYTHLALWSVLATPVTGVSDVAAVPAPGWFATVQLGTGFLAEDVAALMRPRLGFADASGEAILSAPLWLTLVDRTVAGDGTTQSAWAPSFAARFNDPQTYFGFLERLAWSTQERTFALEAGTLSQQTLGHGVLVDEYQAMLDPLRPRTGGRVDVDLGSVAATIMSDSFVRAHLIAASLELTPLSWAGYDAGNRFRVRFDGAVDPLAPRATGQRAAGGGALDATYALVRGDSFGLEVFGAVAGLSRPAWGAHSGVELAWHDGAGRARNAVVLRLDGIAAQRGYAPGYFDVAYELERQPAPVAGIAAKADRTRPGGFGGRLSLDGRLSVARFGLSASQVGRGAVPAASFYVGVTTDRLSVAASWMQRAIVHGGDLVDLGPTGAAMLEASVAVYDGFFIFGHGRRGFRVDGGGPRPVVDWVTGVGFGGATGG
jgi:hypothetical protein